MSLDYQVHFLLDEHVEESYAHGAGRIAAAYAELVSGNDHPSDSFGASVIYGVRGPVEVGVIGIVLPAPVLVGAGLACLGTAIGRLSANPRYVVELRSGEDETCDRVYSRIIEIILFAVTVTFDWPADDWNAKGQEATVHIPFITVSLSKSRWMSTGIVVSRDDLDVAKLCLELGAPCITGD